jgi:hypothetical protein
MKTMLRVLAFRASASELRGLTHRHLLVGLVTTWVVGAGRWWEDPGAHVLQHLGLGSVVYVLVLAAFLWLVTWLVSPLTPPYVNVLTFVSMTALPALLYAIPVRTWFELAAAQQLRMWFLVIVAAWRVLLWARYLKVGVGLSGPATLVVTIFPLAFIVVALLQLNLDRVVFDLMGGVRPEDVTVNDSAYGALFVITAIALFSLIPLLPAYIVLATRGCRSRYAMAYVPPPATQGRGEPRPHGRQGP